MSTLVVNLSAVVNCSSMAPSYVDPSIALTHVVCLDSMVMECGSRLWHGELWETHHSKSDF